MSDKIMVLVSILVITLIFRPTNNNNLNWLFRIMMSFTLIMGFLIGVFV